MKRFAAWMLLAALVPGAARGDDHPPLPTVPLVAAPAIKADTEVIPVAARSGRLLGSLRERVGMSIQVATEPMEALEAPEMSGVASAVPPGCDHCAMSGRGGCGNSIIPGSPIKRWFCFQPTTGHELPWLRPNPYIGPVTGQFRCSSQDGCSSCGDRSDCGPTAGFAKGSGGPGALRGSVRGRRVAGGCANGTCVTPPDEAFPGYKFATPERPGVMERGVGYSTSISYKPTVSPTGLASSAPTHQPTFLESLKRTFSKP
jgi:hypothetical protein